MAYIVHGDGRVRCGEAQTVACAGASRKRGGASRVLEGGELHRAGRGGWEGSDEEGVVHGRGER